MLLHKWDDYLSQFVHFRGKQLKLAFFVSPKVRLGILHGRFDFYRVVLEIKPS